MTPQDAHALIAAVLAVALSPLVAAIVVLANLAECKVSVGDICVALGWFVLIVYAVVTGLT